MPGPENWKKMNAGARVQKDHIVSCMNGRFEISLTYCMSIEHIWATVLNMLVASGSSSSCGGDIMESKVFRRWCSCNPKWCFFSLSRSRANTSVQMFACSGVMAMKSANLCSYRSSILHNQRHQAVILLSKIKSFSIFTITNQMRC